MMLLVLLNPSDTNTCKFHNRKTKAWEQNFSCLQFATNAHSIKISDANFVFLYKFGINMNLTAVLMKILRELAKLVANGLICA